MILDSWLVARLARELDAALAGARLQFVRATRIGLVAGCYRRGDVLALRALLDPSGPIIAVTEGEDVTNENGGRSWAGGVAPVLRGFNVHAVRAVLNDRIVDIDLVSRSAFGVPARYRLRFELEPRKSNILILQPSEDGEQFIVLAALRQFKGEAGARGIKVGNAYEPPPSQIGSLAVEQFAAAADAKPDRETRALVRLLGDFDPRCTPALARDIVERCRLESLAPVSHCLLERWRTMLGRLATAVADVQMPVYVYGADPIAACHLVPLTWAAGIPEEAPSLNGVCAQRLEELQRHRQAPFAVALRKKLETMLARCLDETARLSLARTASAAGDDLRRAGEAIYTNLAAVATGATQLRAADGKVISLDPSLSAKENAALYFKRYKKARSGLARISQRLAALARNREFYEQLLWEIDRADALGPSEREPAYREVESVLVPAKATKRAPARRANVKRHEPVTLPGGATAYIGRSSKDNERLTFSVAAPDDVWFHARGVPGAHVIAKPARARGLLTADQIMAAAKLAAQHSRAARATSVEVDYTRRKHVRRQGKGSPGMVWYSDFKTIAVKM